MIFGAGLGGPIEDEYGSFGEPTDPVIIAERLDEGLDLLRRYWSGEQVDHVGRHYVVDGVTLLPATVQRPHPPVWDDRLVPGGHQCRYLVGEPHLATGGGRRDQLG